MSCTCPSLGGNVYSLSSSGQINESSIRWHMSLTGRECVSLLPWSKLSSLRTQMCGNPATFLKIQDRPVDFMCTDTSPRHPHGYQFEHSTLPSCFAHTLPSCCTCPCLHASLMLHSYCLGTFKHDRPVSSRWQPPVWSVCSSGWGPPFRGSLGSPLTAAGTSEASAPSTGFILSGLHAVRAHGFCLHASLILPRYFQA